MTRAREHALERPELIPTAKALPALPLGRRRMVRSRGIKDFLWAHEQHQ